MPLKWKTHADLAIKRTPSVGRTEYLDFMTFRANRRPLFTEIFGPMLGLKEEWEAQGARPEELDFSAYAYRCEARGWLPVNTGRNGGHPEVLLDETPEHKISEERLRARAGSPGPQRNAPGALPLLSPKSVGNHEPGSLAHFGEKRALEACVDAPGMRVARKSPGTGRASWALLRLIGHALIHEVKMTANILPQRGHPLLITGPLAQPEVEGLSTGGGNPVHRSSPQRNGSGRIAQHPLRKHIATQRQSSPHTQTKVVHRAHAFLWITGSSVRARVVRPRPAGQPCGRSRPGSGRFRR